MFDVKQAVYDAIKETNLPLEDTPVMERKKFPYGIFTTINVTRIRYKNSYKARYLYRFDIFSTYKGEKEVLDLCDDIEQRVFNRVMSDNRTTFVDINHNIMDDKEQGPVTKHGVISILVETLEVPEQ